MARLPNVVFVKWEKPRNDDEYLTVGRNIEEIAPDGLNRAEVVGVYKLVKRSRLIKQVRHV